METIYIKWIVFKDSDSVSIKFPINKRVTYSEKVLTKLLNDNLSRVYDLIPEAKDYPDKIFLQGEE